MISLILIVEDMLGEVVVNKILAEVNKKYHVENCLHWNKDKIMSKINGLNQSACGYVYFVFTDQDTEDRCPAVAMSELSEPKHPNLFYRFAVMEIESWIMADREAFSKFLSVPLNKIPHDTDQIPQPKECVIRWARKSRSGEIKKEIPPGEGVDRKVGPLYNERLSEFVAKQWNIQNASRNSLSLRRTVARLRNFSPTPLVTL